jgi:hypothetical protein
VAMLLMMALSGWFMLLSSCRIVVLESCTKCSVWLLVHRDTMIARPSSSVADLCATRYDADYVYFISVLHMLINVT